MSTLTANSSGSNGNQFLSATGTVQLASVNALNAGSGTVGLDGGTFQLTANGAVASASNLSVQTGATFDINGHVDTVNNVQLVGGTIRDTLGGGVLTSTTTIDAQSGTAGAILAGSNGLSKSTTGTVTLGSANTFTGSTTVGGGTLQVDGSLAVGSAVTVQSGGQLDGAGTVNGSVIAHSSGTIAPGHSPGILNTGNFTLNSGANFNVQLNGTTVGTQYSQDNVTGSVNLNADNGAGANLNVSLGYAPALGDQFVIIKNDLSDPVTGTFAGLPQGGTLTASFNATTYCFSVNYAGGDGNDVVLTAVALTTTITWANPADITYGTALGPTQLDATATAIVNGSSVSVPGTFSYTPATWAILQTGQDQTLNVTFTPTDTDEYTTATATAQINVDMANQSITFTAPPSPITFVPNETVNLSASASSGAPVVFSIDASSTGSGSISGNTLTVMGAGSIFLDANQSGNSNYNAAPQVQQTLVVNKAATTLSVSSSANPALAGVSLTFMATVQVTSPGAGSPTGGVSFYSNGSLLGPGTLQTSNGVTSASYTTAAFTQARTYSITASYGGDGTFEGNTSAPWMQQITPAAPASISIVAGTSQSASLATAFGTALQVVVKDTYGNVISGLAVTFTVQVGSTGASGNFNGSASATATTSASGVASAPLLKAGDKMGSFSVIASVAGLAEEATFSETVTGRGSPVW